MSAESLTIGIGAAISLCASSVAAVIWLHAQLRANADASHLGHERLAGMIADVRERVARIEGALHRSPAE